MAKNEEFFNSPEIRVTALGACSEGWAMFVAHYCWIDMGHKKIPLKDTDRIKTFHNNMEPTTTSYIVLSYFRMLSRLKIGTV